MLGRGRTYAEAHGLEHLVEVPSEHSLMEGARDNGTPGILADCSGSPRARPFNAFQWQAGLPGEKLTQIGEGFHFDRIASGIAKKHGGLFAHFTLETNIGRDNQVRFRGDKFIG